MYARPHRWALRVHHRRPALPPCLLCLARHLLLPALVVHSNRFSLVVTLSNSNQRPRLLERVSAIIVHRPCRPDSARLQASSGLFLRRRLCRQEATVHATLTSRTVPHQLVQTLQPAPKATMNSRKHCHSPARAAPPSQMVRHLHQLYRCDHVSTCLRDLLQFSPSLRPVVLASNALLLRRGCRLRDDRCSTALRVLSGCFRWEVARASAPTKSASAMQRCCTTRSSCFRQASARRSSQPSSWATTIGHLALRL